MKLWKIILITAAVTASVILIPACGFLGYQTYQRAYNGQAAFEYIQQVVAAQQKQAQQQAPTANPPGAPK
jgi:predicted negative regulator of RcsB-dependent stress response